MSTGAAAGRIEGVEPEWIQVAVRLDAMTALKEKSNAELLAEVERLPENMTRESSSE